jgi:ABC-2 type transport system ATP-binding protein
VASNRIPRTRVAAVLAMAGLSDVAGRRVKTFSLGMRQRLGIATALLGDPPVLLMDEPVNGLDPDGVRWIRGLMRSLAAEGRTVFVSSHLLSEMQETADHLVLLGRGRMIADAPPDQVIDWSSRSAVRIRTPDADRFADHLETDCDGRAVGRGDPGGHRDHPRAGRGPGVPRTRSASRADHPVRLPRGGLPRAHRR